MTNKISAINHLLKNKIFISILSVIIIFVLMVYQREKEKEILIFNKLQGYLTVKVDSTAWNRTANYDFINYNLFFDKDSVTLPLIHYPYKRKNIQTYAERHYEYYIKPDKEAAGVWRIISHNPDSIYIYAPNHPFRGKYAVTFKKVKIWQSYHFYIYLTNDSSYIVCEKFFSDIFGISPMMKNWEK